ncbi:MAG: hypothetical protein WC986_13700 [Elusimicrobiota bacterium]|jgi:lysozyme family protein
MTPDFPALWTTCEIRPEKIGMVARVANDLAKCRGRYEAIAREFRMPWEVVAVIDYRESGGGCRCHLHNGDSLKARTVHVPAGRPRGNPPFTWEESARDALHYDGVERVKAWTIEATLDFLERYNGLGYRGHGVRSPYLWAATNHQQAGKYVADGVWSSTAMDAQLGVCALLKALQWAPDVVTVAEDLAQRPLP